MMKASLDRIAILARCACIVSAALLPLGLIAQDLTEKILTPTPQAAPRINGPSIFGVHPRAPFLYSIPATGVRPIEFSAENLPAGLKLDPRTGSITGSLVTPGEYKVRLKALNEAGAARKEFRIVCGDKIALTPPMGWNSWNCWAGAVDQDKVMRSAKGLVESGLSQHGWTYVNIDEGWQGERSGPAHGLQPNKKFPDIKALVEQIHSLGLKAGIYSTPWEVSYGGLPGGSGESEEGAFRKPGRIFGKFSFAKADARQWAEWGFDYLKYDWTPNDLEHVREMSEALRATGRDIVYSLSNTADFEKAADYGKLANCWRTTNDIYDRWQNGDKERTRPYLPGSGPRFGVSEIAFSQDRWAPFGGPGHWNDPDMLVVGQIGWGPDHHATRLTADQQYAHISMWCLLSAPLLLGCDLEKLDAFTLNLLTNDEVLDIDQDALGRPATRMATDGPVDVYVKDLERGAKAVGFFNRSSEAYSGVFNKLKYVGLGGKQKVRDLWRQRDLPDTDGSISLDIPADGVLLLRFDPR